MKFRSGWVVHILVCAAIMVLFVIQQNELSEKYDIGIAHAQKGNYLKASEYMNLLAEYKDAPEKLKEYKAEINYQYGVDLMKHQKWQDALKRFSEASKSIGSEYKDSKHMEYLCNYEQAREYANNYDIYTAELMYLKLPRDFMDVADRKTVITNNKKFKGNWVCETDQGEVQLETAVYIDYENIPRIDVKMYDSDGLLYDEPNVLEGKGLEIKADRFSWDVQFEGGATASLSFVYKEERFTVMKRPIVEGSEKLIFKKVVGTDYDAVNSKYMNANF